jgi:hypothetical protein
VSHQAQPGGVIKIELQEPVPVLEFQLMVDQVGHELRRQPTLNLGANLGFRPTRLG